MIKLYKKNLKNPKSIFNKQGDWLLLRKKNFILFQSTNTYEISFSFFFVNGNVRTSFLYIVYIPFVYSQLLASGLTIHRG
jgi:hypothetical protein